MLPKEAPHGIIGQAVLEKKIFEKGGHKHVYSLGAGADNPLGSNLIIYTIIQSIKPFAASFPH